MMPVNEVRVGQRAPVAGSLNLAHSFNRCFKVLTANTPALQEKAYQLRYQVYCKEHKYENPWEHPEGQETDEFDCRSVHTLLLDPSGASVAGTARLILPRQDSLDESFPMQRICDHPMLSDPRILLTAKSAEVSRFAVSKEFRRSGAGEEALDADTRRVMPFITLGLIRGLVQMSFEYGVTEWFAVMEPSLLRLLARFSVHFRPIGPLVDYHGMRQPCHANLNGLLDRVLKEQVAVWEVITDEGRLVKGSADKVLYHC